MTTPSPMGIREKLRDRDAWGLVAGVGLLAIAGAIIAFTFWPARQADLNQAFYSVDDGKTWFADSAFRVAPFTHDGKEAVVAHVYSYANGSKQFVAYLAKFTAEAKARLDAAQAAAARAGKAPGTVALYGDRTFMRTGVLVKKPGQATWLAYTDPKANEIFAVTAPDGSEVDEVFVK